MSAERAKELVRIGDLVTFDGPARELLNDQFASKTLDDRSCVAILLRAAEMLQKLVCDADAIPEEIAIDVTGREIGDSIHISHVSLPAGSASAITDRDFTIATIVAPSALKSEEGDTEAKPEA